MAIRVRFNGAEPIRTRPAIPPVATVVGSPRNLSHHDGDRGAGGTRRIRSNGGDEPVTRAATAILWLDHRGWESAKLPRLHGQSVDARSAFSSPQSRKRSTAHVNASAFTAHLRSQHMPEARTARLLKRRCVQDRASDNQTRENRDAAPAWCPLFAQADIAAATRRNPGNRRSPRQTTTSTGWST